MAKEEFQGEISYGLEIEVTGEVHEVDVPSDSEALTDSLWGSSKVERGHDQWLAWRETAVEQSRSRLRKARTLLTWRSAAWVAAAALLGFGIGAVAEPAAKQTAQHYLGTDFDLHFDNQPITAPGQIQMARLDGAAWSITPVTALVVHVVNDGTTTLTLHRGTLSGTRFSTGTLVPDGTGVLAPGQRGTLTAQVTVSCNNSIAATPKSSATTRPLTANIPFSADGGKSSSVQLVSGSPQDDLYIASQLCAGLPTPLAISFKDVPGTAIEGGEVIQVTVHNITGQPMRYTPEFGFLPVGAIPEQTIAAGATIEVDIPLSQICTAPGNPPGQPPVSLSVGLYMSTMDGAYQTTHQAGIDTDPRVAAVCNG